MCHGDISIEKGETFGLPMTLELSHDLSHPHETLLYSCQYPNMNMLHERDGSTPII